MKAYGKRLNGLFVLMAVAALTGGTTQADLVVYREIFPTNGWNGVGSDMTHTDWEIRYGTTAVPYTLSHYFGGNTGYTTDLPPVNSHPTEVTNYGLGIVSYNPGIHPSLFYTTEYTVDRSLVEIDTISWYQNNSSADSKIRVAVQIDSNWYFTTNTFSSVGVTQTTLNWADAGWVELNFTAGSTLTEGSAATLPSGNLTGFGLYNSPNEGGNTIRFDTYEINMIPEPATGLLLVSGLALLLVRLFRRQRN